MAKKKTHMAIIYDFDKTLSTSEMQDAFIESIGMDPKEFWEKTAKLAENKEMDNILAYLYEMIRISKVQQKSINRQVLKDFGSKIEFHKGVLEWFDAIKEVATANNVLVDHYIISSGLKEIIEGTPIFKEFKQVYACEFLYDENGVPVWLKNLVNFTSKTQFLFRINKQELDIWDAKGVNEFLPHEERPIPFENMIYIGDGMTDVPCMKLVKQYGGVSIGVYSKSKKDVEKLMYDGRINHYCKADYSKDGDLFEIVSEHIKRISIASPLRSKSLRQYKDAEKKLQAPNGEARVDADNNDSVEMRKG